jgi:hypothetical protein
MQAVRDDGIDYNGKKQSGRVAFYSVIKKSSST